MNCAEVQRLLSAYYDGQLTGDLHSEISAHLGGCPRCAEELADYRHLSTLAREAQTPVPPASIWDRLGAELDEDATSQPPEGIPYRSMPGSRALALAATVLLALGLGWFVYDGSWFSHAEHRGFAAEFGHYLDTFHHDPSEAQKMLIAKYEGKPVAPDQAMRLVGYRPATAGRPSQKYKVKSTNLLTMPCCTCVQTLCQRRDGSTIAIFEHDEENPEWFGDRCPTTENCNGRECSLFDLDDQIAATWKSGTRHITVVGARDEDEIRDLVAWLGDHRQGGPS